MPINWFINYTRKNKMNEYNLIKHFIVVWSIILLTELYKH